MRAWLAGGGLSGKITEIGDAPPPELLERDDDGNVHRYLYDPQVPVPKRIQADAVYGFVHASYGRWPDPTPPDGIYEAIGSDNLRRFTRRDVPHGSRRP